MVKLLDYSRRTSGRAAVSRHQTEFVGFGIKVISFATPDQPIPDDQGWANHALSSLDTVAL